MTVPQLLYGFSVPIGLWIIAGERTLVFKLSCRWKEVQEDKLFGYI